MKLLGIFIIILIIASAVSSRRVKRLAGGTTVENGAYPYQVGIMLYLQDGNLTTWCGGALINHEWVLTAAHCTQSVKSVDILMGDVKISSMALMHPVDRENITIHPEWNSVDLANDISLIKIPYTNYTENIQPIDLPSHENYTSTEAIATGWGSTNDTDRILDHLRMVNFHIISNDDCFRQYPTAIRSSSICVNSIVGSAACGGDSGGPLVLKDPKVLVGISSFTSAAGCSNGYPSAFTRVSSYLNWINQTMAEYKTKHLEKKLENISINQIKAD